jgi:cysteinyl-tRNA synthetase
VTTATDKERGERPALRVYNTMTRKQELFEPLEDGRVKMFTCGPSIYQRPHLGNYRTFLFEDILLRYLEYGGCEVARVMNFTDVEDKAISEAQKQGKTLSDLTTHAGGEFFDDAAILKIKVPEVIPRSSTTVEEAVELIRKLLDKGYAYWDKGDVFFEALKFKEFGKLFRLDLSRWPSKPRRFRKDTYPGVQWNLGDFVLWHGRKRGEAIFWDTAIGKGRPAWNIQDPGIIAGSLGFEIDVHCGGSDNVYRHHDYTIAIMEAISGRELARYWLHGEHLLLDGKKMSKSKGNIVYVDSLLNDGAKPEHIRFYLIYGRRTRKMNLTGNAFREAAAKLDGFRETVAAILGGAAGAGKTDPDAEGLISGLLPGFETRMNDDLDVRGAFDFLFETAEKLATFGRDGRIAAEGISRIEGDLRKMDEVFQVVF